jgi:hypothetical protein
MKKAVRQFCHLIDSCQTLPSTDHNCPGTNQSTPHGRDGGGIRNVAAIFTVPESKGDCEEPCATPEVSLGGTAATTSAPNIFSQKSREQLIMISSADNHSCFKTLMAAQVRLSSSLTPSGDVRPAANTMIFLLVKGGPSYLSWPLLQQGLRLRRLPFSHDSFK